MQFSKFFLIFFILINNGCFAQSPTSFNYRKVTLKTLKLDTSFNNEIKKIKKDSYDLTRCLPKNFVRDGSIDYTSYLQEAISNYKNVIFPNFPVLINYKGLELRNDMTLIFQTNSSLVIQANNSKSYALLSLSNIKNVRIFNPQLIGDRLTHLGVEGEWGMGISIRGSNSILIVNPFISKCWGDGIYIGQFQNISSGNINIYNAFLDYNRRNGISVVSVDTLNVINSIIANTFGTFPMAGIDFEPNNNICLMDNIFIQNLTTYNARYGISIALGQSSGEFNPNINITVNNFIDFYSNIALYISGFKKPENQLHLQGKITFNNPIWKYNNESLVFRNLKTLQFAPELEFNNIKIYKKDDRGKDIIQNETISNLRNSLLGNVRIEFH